MVNKKISQLEEKTDLLLDDEFPFIRKQGNEYTNYKVKISKIIPIIPVANSTQSGVLSTIDWVSFNAKLNSSSNLSDLQSVTTAKINLGLNNIDNTSDLNKPISISTQTAINSLNNTALAYSIALG